jgi:hypothetical protein
VLVHTLPAALHTGSPLHVHAADPAVPVQLWCAPQAEGEPYAQQPLPPRVHVARLPDTHEVSADMQLSLQISEHAAFGAVIEHDCELGHVKVDAT